MNLHYQSLVLNAIARTLLCHHCLQAIWVYRQEVVHTHTETPPLLGYTVSQTHCGPFSTRIMVREALPSSKPERAGSPHSSGLPSVSAEFQSVNTASWGWSGSLEPGGLLPSLPSECFSVLRRPPQGVRRLQCRQPSSS